MDYGALGVIAPGLEASKRPPRQRRNSSVRAGAITSGRMMSMPGIPMPFLIRGARSDIGGDKKNQHEESSCQHVSLLALALCNVTRGVIRQLAGAKMREAHHKPPTVVKSPGDRLAVRLFARSIQLSAQGQVRVAQRCVLTSQARRCRRLAGRGSPGYSRWGRPVGCRSWHL